MARGDSNADIVEALKVSLKMVRNAVPSIFGKPQVADRAQAVSRTQEAGPG
jgi:DNA-binding NarL/FixJ family response regulator